MKHPKQTGKEKKKKNQKKNRNQKEPERNQTYLYDAADDLGKHVERKPEDVKERERHKGLLCIQDVVLIHSHIHSKCCQGNLETQ